MQVLQHADGRLQPVGVSGGDGGRSHALGDCLVVVGLEALHFAELSLQEG